LVTYKVAFIPGDGIGPEVTEQGVRVLERASELDSFEIEWLRYDIGSERYLRTGELVTEEEFSELGRYRGIYFGAIGDPRVKPGVLEHGILLAIRWHFDQYVNLRPVRLFEGVRGALAGKGPLDVNFVCIRENTEDMYSGVGAIRNTPGTDSFEARRRNHTLMVTLDTRLVGDTEFAYELGYMTRKGAERIIRYAFEYAKNHSLGRVATADKANAMRFIYGLWRDTFDRVSREYPGIASEKYYIDALTMWMVLAPERFRVIVLPNLFGDIVTDLGAAIQGGLGIAPSANINPEGTSMFEPVHGSAPEYKGKNMADPLAAVLSGAMLLDHLGRAHTASRIERAVEKVLREGRVRTFDLGGSSGTREMGDAVIRALGESA
jgi:isocitrate/isopropylmalate dehydrogenase